MYVLFYAAYIYGPILLGEDLQAYVESQGWTIDPETGVVTIPPNPDNNVEATVVRENIEMPRKSDNLYFRKRILISTLSLELSKLIARSVQSV